MVEKFEHQKSRPQEPKRFKLAPPPPPLPLSLGIKAVQPYPATPPPPKKKENTFLPCGLG